MTRFRIFRVFLRSKDIADGEPGNPDRCPWLTAIRRAFTGYELEISGNSVRFGEDMDGYEAPLPPAVVSAIMSFDLGHHTLPMAFYLAPVLWTSTGFKDFEGDHIAGWSHADEPHHGGDHIGHFTHLSEQLEGRILDPHKDRWISKAHEEVSFAVLDHALECVGPYGVPCPYGGKTVSPEELEGNGRYYCHRCLSDLDAKRQVAQSPPGTVFLTDPRYPGVVGCFPPKGGTR